MYAATDRVLEGPLVQSIDVEVSVRLMNRHTI